MLSLSLSLCLCLNSLKKCSCPARVDWDNAEVRECPAVYFINFLLFSHSVALGDLVDRVHASWWRGCGFWILLVQKWTLARFSCLLLKEFYKLITCGMYKKCKGQRVSFTSSSKLLLQYANDAHQPNDADARLVWLNLPTWSQKSTCF